MRLITGEHEEMTKGLGHIGLTTKPLVEVITEAIQLDLGRRALHGDANEVAMILFDHADEIMLQICSNAFYSERDQDRAKLLAGLLNLSEACTAVVMQDTQPATYLVRDAKKEVRERRERGYETAYVSFAQPTLGDSNRLYIFF